MTLHRRKVVSSLLKDRKDLLVVAGLGSTAWDVTAAGDSPLNFPTWGAMGQAAMMGLGLALAQPAADFINIRRRGPARRFCTAARGLRMRIGDREEQREQ